jgi:hypothetical protein
VTKKDQADAEMPKGTMDMMILRTLVTRRCARTHDCKGDRADFRVCTGGGAGFALSGAAQA